MRCKCCLFLIVTIIVGSLQISAASLMAPLDTTADFEFRYTYNWDLDTGTGVYEGITQEYRSTGTYKVDVNTNLNIGTVRGEVKWTWKEYQEGWTHLEEEDSEIYTFTYSLLTGKYITGDDQDGTASNKTVWFHLPMGMDRLGYSILGGAYGPAKPTIFMLKGLS